MNSKAKLKILVATSGIVPAKDNADYIVNIAKRLGAELIALHILDEEHEQEGKAALNLFADIGRKLNVPVTKVLRQSDLIPTIIQIAAEYDVGFIVMGASKGRVSKKWVSANVMNETTIPVVVIPQGVE